MKTPFLTSTLVALGALASAASAAPLVHDTPIEFSSITKSQGPRTNDSNTNTQFGAVSSARSNTDNMFDNGADYLTTAYSLGLGGTLALVISPTTNMITSGSLIEWTNERSNHQESAVVSLGLNDGGYIPIATIFNTEFGGTAFVTPVPPNQVYATLTANAAPDNAHSTFYLTVLSGNFNSLRFEDTSLYTLGAGGTVNRDGFDIANLSVSSVPEPTALALAGAAILVLGAARRRKA